MPLGRAESWLPPGAAPVCGACNGQGCRDWAARCSSSQPCATLGCDALHPPAVSASACASSSACACACAGADASLLPRCQITMCCRAVAASATASAAVIPNHTAAIYTGMRLQSSQLQAPHPARCPSPPSSARPAVGAAIVGGPVVPPAVGTITTPVHPGVAEWQPCAPIRFRSCLHACACGTAQHCWKTHLSS